MARHHARHNGLAYTLHHCGTCELEFWWPLKADPSVYVDEGFEAYSDYHAGTRPFPRWAEPLFGALQVDGGKALDVGCGDGAVLGRLASLGFEAHGIDLDEKSIAVARRKYGLHDTQAITLEDYIAVCEAQHQRFDLITFFEVLEHQDDPLGFLCKVALLGRPGAQVAGSVPNRRRFLVGFERRMNDGDLPPHHFLWFSSDALRGLLQRAGFERVTVEPAGALSYATVVQKMRALLHEKLQGTSARRRAAGMLAFFAPLVSVLPWLGGRVAPPKLFFSCRVPG